MWQALTVALALAAASTLLGAGGLFGYQLYRVGRQAERLRVTAMAEVYAAQVAGLTAPTDFQPLVQSWNWHPGSRLLAVLEGDGHPLALRGDRTILSQLPANDGWAHVPRESTCLLPGDSERLLPDVAVATVPIIPPGASRPIGSLVYATRTAGWEFTLSGGVWKCLGAVLAISAAGLAMGLFLLRYSLLEPLKLLVRIGRGESSAGLLPADPPDEIAALARLLEDARSGVEEARNRAACLEASLERRVESQTHSVTLKLRQVERKAWIDPLTRLGNRRLLDDKFGQLFARCRETGEDLALVMIDVDHFKSLNDTLGHRAGDELIVFVGELLSQCVREGDMAIRYGGDEFLLVLPGSTVSGAVKIAERVVRLFGQQARLIPVEPRPSMSAGVALLKEHRPATPAAFLQMADQALYQAKKLGKSRVCPYRAEHRPVYSV